MTQLEYLNLSFNRFSDISPLQGILGTHVVLDLSFNDNLTDISALPSTHYYVLNLTGSPIDYYTAPVLSGTLLLTGYDDAWHDPQCMKEGEGNKFTYVAMVDCPLDQVVAMRERFGQFRMLLLNDVEAYLLKLEEMEIDTEYLHKNLKQ